MSNRAGEKSGTILLYAICLGLTPNYPSRDFRISDGGFGFMIYNHLGLIPATTVGVVSNIDFLPER